MKATAAIKKGLNTSGSVSEDGLKGTARLAANVQPLPNITIGEVETLAPGSDAYATMTGTQKDPVLNLGIPEGEQGVPGQDYVLTSADKSEIAGIVETDIAPTLAGKQDQIYLDINGSSYPILYTLRARTVTGISGVFLYYDNGTVDGGALFLPDGVGMATVADNLDAAIAAKQDPIYVTANGDTEPFYPVISKETVSGVSGVRLQYGVSGANDVFLPDSVALSTALGGINTALAGKQDTLTFDDTPTEDSANPVKSGGVYSMGTFLLGEIADNRNWVDANKADAADTDTTHTALRAASIPMGKLDSTSTSTDMTATIPGITELRNGVCMWLTNGVVSSASGYTININGLGGKPVYQSQAAATRTTTLFNINYTALFIYNEDRVADGCWDYVYGYDSNTNTIGYQIRTNSSTRNMTDKVYRYRLLFSSADDAHFVPANNSTSTNATAARTPISTPINPFGDIVYYGYTTAIDAGSAPGASYLWQQYAVTLGYSFSGITLTAKNSVYLVCNPQTNGSAIIDSSTPIAQELPTTADGKIYIYLGIATSGTAFELKLNHPVYHYYNGSIRLWTGPV